jgi:hypothetical protein
MKPANDDINWQVVHRTHEGNPVQLENKEAQYWNEQLRCINQRLFNLEQIGLSWRLSSELKEKYQREQEFIWQQVDRLK